MGGGDGSGSGSGSGSDDTPKALDATGKYMVQSQFDVEANMPGTAGEVVRAFIDATDDPDDPTRWILDQIIAQMPSGTFKSILQGAEGFVAGYLNDQLLSIAPNFVVTILDVGNDFGDIAKHFGIDEELDVAKMGTDYMSVVTANGVHFKVNGTDLDYAFADYQLQNVIVNNVGVQLDATAKMTIAEHKLPIAYGKVLRLGLDNAIIPLVDPNATNLGELLADNIDCSAVGQAIDDALASQFGYGGGASFWTSACSDGLQFGANAIYQKIDAIDGSALEFDVTGTAKALDTNQDLKVDTIQTGKWDGTLSYAGTPAPLSTATFNGKRM